MILFDNFLILRIVHGEFSTPTAGKTAVKPLPASFTFFWIGSAHGTFRKHSTKQQEQRRTQHKHNFHTFIDGSKNIACNAADLPGNPPHI